MTVREALALADELAPNTVSKVLKIRWLSELDGRVSQEILSPSAKSIFKGYTPDTKEDTVLLVPYPYDGIYPTYIKMQVDQLNGEMKKYNDGAAICEEQLTAYRHTLVRTEAAPTRRIKYF